MVGQTHSLPNLPHCCTRASTSTPPPHRPTTWTYCWFTNHQNRTTVHCWDIFLVPRQSSKSSSIATLFSPHGIINCAYFHDLLPPLEYWYCSLNKSHSWQLWMAWAMTKHRGTTEQKHLARTPLNGPISGTQSSLFSMVNEGVFLIPGFCLPPRSCRLGFYLLLVNTQIFYMCGK